jgi:hypothetical protein
MRFFGPGLRFWLVAWLALALPLAGYARPTGVSCRMACAQGMKGCHACCDQKPGCGLTAAAKAIPAAPAKAVAASAAAPDTPLPAASVVLLHPAPPLLLPASGQTRYLGSPRIIDVQAAHCARLL